MNSTAFLSIKNELYRKIIHISSSAIPLFYFFYDKKITTMLLIIFLIVIVLIDMLRIKNNYFGSLFKKILGSFVRDYENDDFMSATYLVASSFLTVVLFDKYTAILSLLILSICDSAAAIAGMRFGKIKVYNHKTIEGTLAFILSGLFVLIFYNSLINIQFNYLFIIMILIVSVVEHVTPTKFDNISIPLSSALIISFFNIL